MNFTERILQYRVLDNTIQNLVIFAGIMLVAFVFKRYISVLIGRGLYRFFRRYSREDRFAAFKHKLLKPMQWFLVLMIVMFGVGVLRYPKAWQITLMDIQLYSILTGLLRAAIVVAFTWVLLRIVDFLALVGKERAAGTDSKLDDQLVPFIKDSVKLFIAVFALLFILGSIMKLNIASLIAGVGIGGLAIALAAQESLKNLFASITIFMDKPFQVGDSVTAGNVSGVVENIGFRSTRLRTADKTFVTLPNKIMVDEAVDNQTMRSERRVNILIVLGFDTTLEQIRVIVSELEGYFKQHLETKDFENIVRFDDFMANGFRLNITYFVPIKTQVEFMLTREQVNFKIVEVVQKHKAAFAKTLHQVELLPQQPNQ